ncbi:MAG: hypothetical protein AB1705_16040 [Verrucomicrobiota bacterium]
MRFAIGGEISARHWLETARRCGFPGLKAVMEEVIARTPQVLERVRQHLPGDFPAEIAEPILTGTARAARVLAEGSSKAV